MVNNNVINMYQILILVVSVFCVYLTVRLEQCRHKLSMSKQVIAVVDKERRRLQEQYEGFAKPVPASAFIEWPNNIEFKNKQEEE